MPSRAARPAAASAAAVAAGWVQLGSPVPKGPEGSDGNVSLPLTENSSVFFIYPLLALNKPCYYLLSFFINYVCLISIFTRGVGREGAWLLRRWGTSCLSICASLDEKSSAREPSTLQRVKQTAVIASYNKIARSELAVPHRSTPLRSLMADSVPLQ